MQAAQRLAERSYLNSRWVALKQTVTLKKTPEERLLEQKDAEQKEAEQRQAAQRQYDQTQEWWRQGRQKQREQWDTQQRWIEEMQAQLNPSVEKIDVQETRTTHIQVLTSPSICEELKILDDLLKEVRLSQQACHFFLLCQLSSSEWSLGY